MARKKIGILGFTRNTPGHGLSPVNYYRAYLPLKALEAHDKRFEVKIILQNQLQAMLQELGPATDKLLLGRELYVVSRIFSQIGLDKFVSAIHNAGGKIIFDTDDDLTDDFRDLGRGEDFKVTIRAMDLVTVSTPFLADRLAPYLGYRPPVLYNHVDVTWFSQESYKTKKSFDGITVGFIGTASHHADWKYPVEALKRIAEERQDVIVVAAGFFPEYLQELPNVRYIEPVPYGRYPSMMRQFDIVCCSLDPDDTFNKSKSSIKALEAMAAVRKLPGGKHGGAVPVCTDMPVYRRTVNNHHNGLLTSNDNWYETLMMLLEDRALRTKLSVQGFRWVKRNRDIKTGWKHWSKVWRRLNDRQRPLYTGPEIC